MGIVHRDIIILDEHPKLVKNPSILNSSIETLTIPKSSNYWR